MATLAAVDLGAQSGRVAVGRFDGERSASTEVHRFPNVPVRDAARRSTGTSSASTETCSTVSRAAAREAGHVDSVAVDSWAVDFGLIDSAAGGSCRTPSTTATRRRARAMDGVLERVPAARALRAHGHPAHADQHGLRARRDGRRRRPALAAAETLLLIPDLLHYWLCGARTSEFTNATTTQCFDPRAGTWAADLLERLGVPSRLLPEVVAARHAARAAQRRASPRRRASRTREVVAVATHDTGSAVAAVPFRQPGSVFISAGTWSLVGLEVRRAA